MRHKKKKLQIGRDQDHKESLVRNMATQIFLYDKIKTTERKADFIIPHIERLITKIKQYDTVRSIRYLNSILRDEIACRKVLEVYKERYKDQASGFTRKTKLKYRKGDNALLVLLELT